MNRCSVLMICMGNICRSPTAEGVLREKLTRSGLSDRVVVDSAGTHAWHEGEPPDPRSVRHARRRGYDIASLRARPVIDADFERFDLILAMDADNLVLLQDRCPAEHLGKLGRLTGHAQRFNSSSVPDPYSGGAEGFELALDLIEDACDGLVGFLALRVGRQ